MSAMTIGIIGGGGQMGRWFQAFFKEAGFSVLVSGRRTALTYVELARRSDVVMLSVPVGAVRAVCREIGPLLGPSQLLTDICSLKEGVMKSMLTAPSVQVVGTHPLFGPTAEKLDGQNVIICPGRGTDRLTWLEGLFRESGAVLTRMDPAEHDRQMALVQGLAHFLTITLGRTLQAMNLRPRDALKVSTPVFRTQLSLVGRLFALDHGLYIDLIRHNPYVAATLETFLASLDESRRELIDSDQETAAGRYLQNIHDFINSFCDQGLSESNRFLDALYSGFHKQKKE